MRSLSDYRYWKIHFDCLKASNCRYEKPMGVHLTPLGRSRVNHWASRRGGGGVKQIPHRFFWHKIWSRHSSNQNETFSTCSLIMSTCTSVDIKWMMSSLIINPKSLEGGSNWPPPSMFLALNFCSLTDCQKLWHNCSLFVNTSFDTN